MPDRDVSLQMLRAMFAEVTDQVPLDLITITHPSLGAPVRLVNNNEDVVSNGHTFTAWPFKMQLPDDDGTSDVPQITLSADMVDKTIADQIRALAHPMPAVKYQVVLADTPDNVEAGPYTFDAVAVQFAQSVMTATIGYENDWLNEPFPGTQCTPNNNPGQFQ